MSNLAIRPAMFMRGGIVLLSVVAVLGEWRPLGLWLAATAGVVPPVVAVLCGGATSREVWDGFCLNIECLGRS